MTIQGTLREALSTRIPGADFSQYFAFIESLPLLQMGGHKHHILPQKEFLEYVKNPDNLIRVTSADHFKAHYWLAVCAPSYEPFQRVFFFMTNFKRYASSINGNELPELIEIYERGCKAQANWAGELGRIQGRKNVENGHLKRVASTGGRIGGRQNVESGHLDRIRTTEICAEGGRVAGAMHAKNGHLNRIRALAIRKNIESGWAAELGRRAVESGQWDRVRKTANHVRWHVNRDNVNLNCELCQGAV